MNHPILGLDVAQKSLSVALMHDEQVAYGDFDNTPKGFERLQRWVQARVTQRVNACLEATGRYSDALAEYLYAADWVEQVSVVNPKRIHAYAQSQLRRSKTDKGDAWLIAHFAATQKPQPWHPASLQQQALQEMVRHRDNLLDARQQVRNRLNSGVRTPAVQRQLQEQEALLTHQIDEVEAEIQAHIKQDEQMHHQFDLLCSIPGVGRVLAAHFLAEVPDIRRFDDAGQLAAFAGLVPTQHDSGTSVKRKGKLSKSGNVHLRKAFYMPALVAARYNPVIATFVTRLQEAGDKSKMTIVGAVMHKLLRLAYGVLKSNRPFDPNFAANHHFAT